MLQKEKLDKENIKFDERAMSLNPNSEEYKAILADLAKEGKFDVHTTKINTNNMKEIDENYVYRPRNVIYKLTRAVVKSILSIFGPVVNKVAFNIKIKGRKNLKGLKSAITISNHVHFMDILMNMQAVRKRNFYVVAANHNMKKGFTGYLFKASGVLPLSSSLGASKNLNKTIAKILENGGFVHMYAESALWFRYEKSRPLKIGAFKIAAENNVPVVPIVILFRNKSKFEFFRHKKTVTIMIGKPIYPILPTNENKFNETQNVSKDSAPALTASTREIAEYMLGECQKYYNDTVCDFYGYDKSTYSIYEKEAK